LYRERELGLAFSSDSVPSIGESLSIESMAQFSIVDYLQRARAGQKMNQQTVIKNSFTLSSCYFLF
jgi:hypothetical protein